MRIPNAAELFAFFVSTGQLTGLSNQRKIVVILFYDLYEADTRRFSFHIAVADLNSEALAPSCARSYKVEKGDICNSIAERFRVPTLVSL